VYIDSGCKSLGYSTNDMNQFCTVSSTTKSSEYLDYPMQYYYDTNDCTGSRTSTNLSLYVNRCQPTTSGTATQTMYRENI
jgi:hypothetical protein